MFLRYVKPVIMLSQNLYILFELADSLISFCLSKYSWLSVCWFWYVSRYRFCLYLHCHGYCFVIIVVCVCVCVCVNCRLHLRIVEFDSLSGFRDHLLIQLISNKPISWTWFETFKCWMATKSVEINKRLLAQ